MDDPTATSVIEKFLYKGLATLCDEDLEGYRLPYPEYEDKMKIECIEYLKANKGVLSEKVLVILGNVV